MKGHRDLLPSPSPWLLLGLVGIVVVILVLLWITTLLPPMGAR
jgi:hypothetical protein